MTQVMATDTFLAHYGVKGMRWGHRKADRPDGVSARTSREAKKDANEFTRAKMFYGEGAGTRRKLIKATVEAKSAKDASYKKAFDHHVNNTDMSKRASQARGERRRKNTANSTRKTARGVGHILNGNNQYANATAALAVGGVMYAHKTGIDRAVLNALKGTVSNLSSPSARSNMRTAEDMLRKAGFK